MREVYLKKFKEYPRFTYIQHPGYQLGTYDENEVLVGTAYAREINQAKLFFTCDSVYQYPLMKYFEVLACRTLLLATNSPELEALGFITGVHFVAVTEEDVVDKANYYLENYQTVGRKIAKRGYRMVREQHAVKVRAIQLVEQISRILEEEKGVVFL